VPTKLVALANARGGDDNITVIVVQVDALDPEPLANGASS
jgi:serine/threonine protein phosphatase PrpC